jgi:hypothetical protein
MKKLWIVSLGLLLLTACNDPAKSSGAPWALGEQPNFSGTIIDWAKGDAIAPAEGSIYARFESVDGSESVDLGYGSIKADSSFTFGLQRGAAFAGGGMPPEQALCPDIVFELTLSNPQQRIGVVGYFEVPPLYEEGKHARPIGAVRIRTRPPSAGSLFEQYAFTYASADGTIKGSCSTEGIAFSFDLDLRKGWNSVYFEAGGGFKLKTAAIPQEAKWYFVNPLTIGGE